MPYFTYARLNLNLGQLPIIGFQHFIALWKAYIITKATRLHNFCKEISHIFLHRHFQIFLNTQVIKMLKMFMQIWIRWVKVFSKMYNLLQFAGFFSFAKFLLKNLLSKKKLKLKLKFSNAYIFEVRRSKSFGYLNLDYFW